jgi:serine/threonine protein kinase/DNA-binding response OmpR family regulator
VNVPSGRSEQRSNTLSRAEFVHNLSHSGLLALDEANKLVEALAPPHVATDTEALAQKLIAAGKLTAFQARAVLDGKYDELLIGNYEVLDRLGAGGMGTVFKARHRRMKRIVALKVLSPSVAQAPAFVQRFQREVETVARLSHPHIVMAYDADEAPAGHFLVMEFVEGRDLATEVQARGPLPVGEAIDCIIQGARGLAYAHSKGIFHRDVKPANFLRDVNGVVKLADLGLARLSSPLDNTGEQKSSLTQAGGVLGTVDYMPPEQAIDSTCIDQRADIYSLGCTLFFLLNGRPPYQAETLMAALLKHREGPVPSLCALRPEVPAALDTVFHRMVAKKPDDRYASMTEVVSALAAIPAQPGPAAVDLAQPYSDATMDIRSAGPVLADTAPIAQQLSATMAAPAPLEQLAVTLRILLIEPSRAQSVIIRKYAQQLGATDVLTVSSGREGLDQARAARPQAVISALHLPDMTGMQLVQLMRGEPALAETRFVLITSASDSPSASSQAAAVGVVLLQKPFDIHGLAQALSQAGVSLPKSAPVPSAAADTIKALIVDDSPAARSHVRRVLAGLGISNVVEAGDGADAVGALSRQDFDLVITDFNMPRLDGRGLIEFIRTQSSRPQLPVIMVTTETDPAKLETVKRLGVAAILDKSFNANIVRGIVTSVRGQRAGVQGSKSDTLGMAKDTSRS